VQQREGEILYFFLREERKGRIHSLRKRGITIKRRKVRKEGENFLMEGVRKKKKKRGIRSSFPERAMD